MGQATFSVRMDDKLKTEFENLCNSFGMNMTTAINVFARAVVKERRIPFEISAPDMFSKENAKMVFDSLRKQAQINGTADLSMDEIDEEIKEAHEEK